MTAKTWRTGMTAIITALWLSGLASATPVPWTQWPEKGALHYNNYYQDPNINFDSMPQSRQVFDLENDKTSTLYFVPPDPDQSEVRSFRLVSELRSGAVRDETFEVMREKGQAKWSAYHVIYRAPGQEIIREGDFDMTEPALRLTPDAYHGNSMIFILMGLPFKVGYEQNMIGWTTPQIAFELTATVTAIEPVTVPAGTFQCYKVEVKPVVSDYFGTIVGTLVRPFVPPFMVWYAVDEPHFLVKFEGGVAVSPSLDMPVIVRELVAIEGGEAPK